jgi:hypothetical protein
MGLIENIGHYINHSISLLSGGNLICPKLDSNFKVGLLAKMCLLLYDTVVLWQRRAFIYKNMEIRGFCQTATISYYLEQRHGDRLIPAIDFVSLYTNIHNCSPLFRPLWTQELVGLGSSQWPLFLGRCQAPAVRLGGVLSQTTGWLFIEVLRKRNTSCCTRFTSGGKNMRNI